jgi:hypothetical protein
MINYPPAGGPRDASKSNDECRMMNDEKEKLNKSKCF